MTLSNARLSTILKRNLVMGTTFIVGLLLGAIALFVFQNLGFGDVNRTEVVAPTELQRSLTEDIKIDAAVGTVGVGEFQAIFKHRNLSKRYEVLYSTLSRATEQELHEWWIQSQKIEQSSQRNIAQDAILQNLSVINPHAALQYIEDISEFQTNVFLKSVFNQWSISQLDGAIEAAAELSFPRRNVALHAILETHDDLPEEKRLEIARQLGGEQHFLKLISDAQIAETLSEPKKAWDILLNDEVEDSSQIDSLEIVAKAWYEQFGFEVISNIYAEIEDFGSQVHLVRAIARTDYGSALNYTRSLAAAYDKLNLSAIIVRDWAKTDAQGALAAVSTLGESSFASTLEDEIAKVWARTAPFEVIDNIQVISAKLRLATLETAFANIARQDPLEALAELSSAEVHVGNTSSIVKKIVLEWSYKQPEAAANWVGNHFAQDDQQRYTLLTQVLPRLAREDPDKVFKLALAQPTSSEKINLEHVVIREIARVGNVEVARKLLPHVKEDAKGMSYASVAEAMIRESQYLDALELGNDLNEDQRWGFRVRVLGLWAVTNPKALHKTLDDLPTSEIESQAALHLILTNRRQPVLTDDQIEHVKTLLSVDDTASLKRLVKTNEL